MKITFLDGKRQGAVLEFATPPVTIGRDPSNLIALDTNGVSRCHAELKQRSDGRWIICDLNSTNGVKLNGTRVDGEVELVEGCQVEIGENHMVISDLQGAPAPVIFNPIVSPPPSEVQQESLFRETPPVPGKVLINTMPLPDLPADPPPPPAVPPIAPAAPQPAPEKKGQETLMEDLKKFSGPLFGRKGKSEGGFFGGSGKGGDAGPAASTEAEKKKRRGNMVFYTVLVCVIIMVLSSAFQILGPKKTASRGGQAHQALVVRYEKEVMAKGNAFRFDFYLRSRMEEAEPDAALQTDEKKGKRRSRTPGRRRVYYAVFTIDDISSRRHYTKETALSDDTVEQLRTAIKGSGIYAVAPSKAPRDAEENRSLLIVEGPRIFKMAVPGEYASPEFNTVEDAVISVAESFGLKTIALTPEQLMKQAEEYFLKAEDLFDNRAKISNLRDSIIRYRAVVESLEQFSPKPKMWDRAKKKLDQALKERNAKLEVLNTEFKRLSQMKDFPSMRQVFLDQMELTEPDSKEYGTAKRRLVIIDQALRKKKRK